MIGKESMFKSLDKNDNGGFNSITFGDNSKGDVMGLGKVAISNDKSLFNVLLVDTLNLNLLSVAQLCDLGYRCIFDKEYVEVVSKEQANLIFKGFQDGSLYLVDFNASESQLSSCLIGKSRKGWLWHRRLGHVGMKQLNKLVKHDLVRGLHDVTFGEDRPCSACQAGMQHGNSHPKKNEMSTSRAFELLHMDFFGPTTYTSIGGQQVWLCDSG
jgi:hypothetical protein